VGLWGSQRALLAGHRLLSAPGEHYQSAPPPARVAASAFTRPKRVKRLIGWVGRADTVEVMVEPSSSFTVTCIPRKRSGSSWVEPSIGEKTDIPKRNESSAPKLPGAEIESEGIRSAV
jgi:hypothetical protein